MANGTPQNNVWKWVAALLATALLSGAPAYLSLLFVTGKIESLSRQQTEQGVRLSTLSDRFRVYETEQSDRLARIESKLEFLAEGRR